MFTRIRVGFPFPILRRHAISCGVPAGVCNSLSSIVKLSAPGRMITTQSPPPVTRVSLIVTFLAVTLISPVTSRPLTTCPSTEAATDPDFRKTTPLGMPVLEASGYPHELGRSEHPAADELGLGAAGDVFVG